jgi:hypothetical protein
MENLLNDPEYKARLWAKNHPDFIRPDSDLLKEKKVKPMDETVAQTIPVKMPTGIPKRFICKYCNKTFAYKTVYQGHLTRCKVLIKEDTIKPIVKEDATKLQPVVCSPTVAEVVNAYAPTTQTFGTPANIMAPLPPVPATFSVSRLYDYLVALILLAILLCGVIYAALGIKMLFGI